MSEFSNWSYLQSPDDILVGRYFEYDSYSLALMSDWLSFLSSPSTRVLEVGSGTGFFTHILLDLFPDTSLTCLEPDPVFASILSESFGKRVAIINESIENCIIKERSFDAAISHIVIHNLSKPLIALRKMGDLVREGGHVITIEPTTGSRHHLPSEELSNAFDLLFEAQIVKCIRRQKAMGTLESVNPFSYCYPQFFEEIGFSDIHCYGLTSVFTLSDSRFNYDEKKRWIEHRYALFQKKRHDITEILLTAGKQLDEINRAYSIVLGYLGKLMTLSEEELSHVHEQEIYHRVITIGSKS